MKIVFFKEIETEDF